MQRTHKVAGATHTEKYAPTTFKVMDQRIDRGRGKRIASHQQRMNRKRLTQQRVFEVAFHNPRNRMITFQTQQAGDLRQHGSDLVERPVRQFFKADLKDGF